jgi:hypothetical protein
MKLIAASLLWILVAPTALAAQTSPSSNAQVPPRATVSGIVTKDPGSDPLKKALIELIAESQNEGGNYTGTSGPDGTFRIENIVPGRYRLFVERAGYQEMGKDHRRSEGRVLTLVGGQELKDLSIRLQAAAVVEGRVTDEDGDPMPEAQVAVMRRTFVAGRSRWEQAGAERTNDLGEYRIASLSPGNYFVSVTPPPDFRSLIETTGNALQASSIPDKPSPTAYQTTYYPGTRDRGQASAIQLHAGEDFSAHFSLSPAPTLTIRGSVVNLPPGPSASIMLQSRDFNLVLNGAEMHKDGSFEIRDVAPGSYAIVATLDNVPTPMMARQSLQLAESIEGLRLSPQPGGTIIGQLRMQNNGSTPADPSQIFLLLRSLDIDGEDGSNSVTIGTDFSNVAHVNANGSFEWKNIPAGKYSVEKSDASGLPDWYLKSAMMGGQDVEVSGIQMSGGIAHLSVVLSSNGGAANGAVSNEKNDPAPDAIVVAVPEERFRNHPDRYYKALTDQSGHFALRGLPPGNYTLFAFESLDGEQYYDPEFLRAYTTQGKAIRTSEGSRSDVLLKAIPAGNDPQN